MNSLAKKLPSPEEPLASGLIQDEIKDWKLSIIPEFESEIAASNPIEKVKVASSMDGDSLGFIEDNLSVPHQEDIIGLFENRMNKHLTKSNLFYEIKDPSYLCRLGQSFYEEIKEGKSFFLFSPIIKNTSDFEVTFAIAAFLEHSYNVKTLCITEAQIPRSLPEIKNCEENISKVSSFISTLATQKLFQKGEILNEMTMYEKYIDNLIKQYDCILFDLVPSQINKDEKKYIYPLLTKINSVSYILRINHSKYSALERAREFFHQHRILEKGIISEVSFQ